MQKKSIPLILSCIVYVIFSLFIFSINSTSLTPHYVYLSDAFLQGKLALQTMSPTTFDLINYQDSWYVANAPMPAVLLMPLTYIFGNELSDILFTVCIGILNIVLLHRILRLIAKKWEIENVSLLNWITVLFAFGTPHLYLSTLGNVWFTSQIVQMLFILLFIYSTVANKSSLLSGFLLGCAVLARPTALFAAPFFMLYRFANKKQWIPFIGMIIGTIGLLCLYNYGRFGNPFDFGYAFLNGSSDIVSASQLYGNFHPFFLKCNSFTMFIGLPSLFNKIAPGFQSACSHLISDGVLPRNSLLDVNPIGMSIFITTPPLLWVGMAIRRSNQLVYSSWVALICTLLPILLFHNTGSAQFGYRYILDCLPFMIILLLFGLSHSSRTRLWQFAILMAIGINIWGWVYMKGLLYSSF